MGANERQVGGAHYKGEGRTEHWDIVVQHELDYFQGQITKYVMRWRKKGGIQDLEKARHFLDKYIEVEGQKAQDAGKKSSSGMAPDRGQIRTGPTSGCLTVGGASLTPSD